jgi:hypothetical protein
MRSLGIFWGVAMVIGSAFGDAAPDPPPKGTKVVEVTSQLTLDKGVSGYVFVKEVGQYAGSGIDSEFGKVDLGEEKTVEIAKGGHHKMFAIIYAVPEATAKQYESDQSLFDALKERKVKGVLEVNLARRAEVSNKVKEKAVTWKYLISGIDAKDGIKMEVRGEGYEKPADKKDKPLALSEPGALIGGLAAAVSITLGGLWLVRRKRG